MTASNITVTIAGLSFSVLPNAEGTPDYAPFWGTVTSGRWEPGTFDFIRRLSGPGSLFIDLGGWIGPTSLYAAAAGAEVHVFEPDPVALRMLRANIDANEALKSKIHLTAGAAAVLDGEIELFTALAGNSETSVFEKVQRGKSLVHHATKIVAPSIDLVAYLRRLGPQERRMVLKMDIEGGEFSLLPQLAAFLSLYDVVLNVTLHPPNVVRDNHDDTVFSRILAIAAAIRPYENLLWYSLENTGFLPVNRKQKLLSMLNDTNRDLSLIMSTRPIS